MNEGANPDLTFPEDQTGVFGRQTEKQGPCKGFLDLTPDGSVMAEQASVCNIKTGTALKGRQKGLRIG